MDDSIERSLALSASCKVLQNHTFLPVHMQRQQQRLQRLQQGGQGVCKNSGDGTGDNNKQTKKATKSNSKPKPKSKQKSRQKLKSKGMKQKATEGQSHGESSSMWLFSGESEGGEGMHNVSPLLRGAPGGGALEGFDFLLDSVGASASSVSDFGGSTSASAGASAGATEASEV